MLVHLFVDVWLRSTTRDYLHLVSDKDVWVAIVRKRWVACRVQNTEHLLHNQLHANLCSACKVVSVPFLVSSFKRLFLNV